MRTYGLALVLLRLIGLTLLCWWLAGTLLNCSSLVEQAALGNWKFVSNMWSQSTGLRFWCSAQGWLMAAQLVLALYLVFGARILARWLTRGTATAGCIRCGYDLAGLRSKQCPECGAQSSAPGAS